MNNSTFVEFMDRVVRPAKKANPNDKRLDGQLSGGNRTVFGCFQHLGRTWKVHSDSHYQPLMLAYDEAVNGGDPFIENITKGGRYSLILQPRVKEHQSSKHKYHYIYEI